MGPGNPSLDRYILDQTGVPEPYVCFLATASGDPLGYINRFYDNYGVHRCKRSHLPLFARTPDCRELLLKQDLILVGGGNTRSMLAVWRDWGVDTILREAWEKGVVLAGVSAGAICWFEQGLTDSYADRLEPLNCLGFLKGSFTPHYDSELDRRPMLHKFVGEGAIGKGIALDDWVAAHYIDDDLARIVSAKLKSGAYQMERVDGKAVETPLDVQYFGTTE